MLACVGSAWGKTPTVTPTITQTATPYTTITPVVYNIPEYTVIQIIILDNSKKYVLPDEIKKISYINAIDSTINSVSKENPKFYYIYIKGVDREKDYEKLLKTLDKYSLKSRRIK